MEKGLRRRFEEIGINKIDSVQTNAEVSDFYYRIFDFVKYIEENSDLKKIFYSIKNDKELKNFEKDLIEKGDIIFNKISEDYKRIDTAVKEKKVELPTPEEIHDKYGDGAYSPTLDEQAGDDFYRFKNILDRSIYIEQVPNEISSFLWFIGSLKALNIIDLESEKTEYYKKLKEYRNILEKRKRRSEYIKLNDYESLIDLFEAIGNPQENKFYLFFFSRSGDIIRNGFLSQTHIVETRKEMKKYANSVARILNAIEESIDKKKARINKIKSAILSVVGFLWSLVLKLFGL